MDSDQMSGGRFVILTYLGSYGPWIFPRNAQLAWVFYKLDDNLAKTLSEPISKRDSQKYLGAHRELEVHGEQGMQKCLFGCFLVTQRPVCGQISAFMGVSWPPEHQSLDRLELLWVSLGHPKANLWKRNVPAFMVCSMTVHQDYIDFTEEKRKVRYHTGA